MTVQLAGRTFFLDVREFATRSQFAVPANHAPARERPETQEPHQTHDP
jgi:hypothetical protein